MKTNKIKVARKIPQAVNFQLSHKYTVFIWDSNYLNHLDKVGAEQPESSFVFGRSNKKYPHPTAFYIASVMSSILHRTNDQNPYVAKIATEMTFLFNDELSVIYEDLYVEAQKIKKRLVDEKLLFDNNECNISEIFSQKKIDPFNLVAPARIVTKNAVLLIRVLKLLDNAVCDLETLGQLCVVPPSVFHQEKRALGKPIRKYFLDVSAQAKKFHLERKKNIQAEDLPVCGELEERAGAVGWLKRVFPCSSLFEKLK